MYEYILDQEVGRRNKAPAAAAVVPPLSLPAPLQLQSKWPASPWWRRRPPTPGTGTSSWKRETVYFSLCSILVGHSPFTHADFEVYWRLLTVLLMLKGSTSSADLEYSAKQVRVIRWTSSWSSQEPLRTRSWRSLLQRSESWAHLWTGTNRIRNNPFAYLGTPSSLFSYRMFLSAGATGQGPMVLSPPGQMKLEASPLL